MTKTTPTPDPIPARLSGPAPRCGACGYDTTGLTTLTCPECGADLRAAGITRGRPTSTPGGFAASAFLFVVLWAVCGLILAGAVATLSPQRQFFEQTVTLGSPRS